MDAVDRPSSAVELAARLQAERAGVPFLLYHEIDGAQLILTLDAQVSPVTIGRGEANTVSLPWDANVSRAHAEVVCVGGEWVFIDDGLSRNGSYLNGERVTGRRRLCDRDVIRIGLATLVYRSPDQPGGTTAIADGIPTVAQLSPAQRRVLIALARPFAADSGYPTPATNQQIASELFLSVDAVKTHLRAIGVKFGVQSLPQNQKRAKLVERALNNGVITNRDLNNPGR